MPKPSKRLLLASVNSCAPANQHAQILNRLRSNFVKGHSLSMTHLRQAFVMLYILKRRKIL